MPTYATAADCIGYTPGLVVDDPAAFATLIEAAERDVDTLTGPWPRRADTGLKLEPALLPDRIREALARAVAAQVEWTLRRDREAFLGIASTPVTAIKGPDFEQTFAVSLTRAGLPPDPIAPRVAKELAPLADWIRRPARAGA